MAVALLAAGEAAHAQTIAGRITQQSAGTPITGAFVYLATDSGAVAARTLTGADGYFALAVVPGRYDLHVEFIGHEPVIVHGLMLSANETIRRDVAMQVHAIPLERITASTERRCRNAAESGPLTQALWQEARTALRVTRWSLEQGALRFGLVHANRQLDPVTLKVRTEEVRNASRYSSGSPYVSRPAEELATLGFVTRAPDGAWDFWAPDAPVLLSDAFLESHCFHAVPPRDSEVGLAFEPMPGRHLPEIEGVLWLDVHTFELKRLDFRYVNLPYGPRADWQHVGGRVEFERLPNGMWIVRRWYIRMPVLEARTSSAGPVRAHDVVLTAINEVSGEVTGPDTTKGAAREEPEDGAEPEQAQPPAAAVDSNAQGGAIDSDTVASATRLRLHFARESLAAAGEPRPDTSAVITLEEIQVETRSLGYLAETGFYDRRERGFGWFMDAQEIDRRSATRVSDLLRRAPGIRITRQGAFGSDFRVITATRLQGDCPPAIYIDGRLARYPPYADPPLSQLVDPFAVAAIEIFRRASEVPAAYTGSTAACGVLLVWLKH